MQDLSMSNGGNGMHLPLISPTSPTQPQPNTTSTPSSPSLQNNIPTLEFTITSTDGTNHQQQPGQQQQQQPSPQQQQQQQSSTSSSSSAQQQQQNGTPTFMLNNQNGSTTMMYRTGAQNAVATNGGVLNGAGTVGPGGGVVVGQTGESLPPSPQSQHSCFNSPQGSPGPLSISPQDLNPFTANSYDIMQKKFDSINLVRQQ